MRRIALMLTMLAALGLAACNNNASNGNGQAKKKVAQSVTGSVNLMSKIQLSPKATMKIQLVDASAEDAPPLASKSLSSVDSLPVQFKLDFDSSKINPAHIYLVKVDLKDGERTFRMPVQSPVITRHAPTSKVTIMLEANKTPEEKLEAKFEKLKKNLGGYAISNGRQLEKHESRGWQTFRSNDDGKIVFVRENIEYVKDGFSSGEFAYNDGKPWFVVVNKMSSQNAKPSSTMRAGWDDQGNLVVHDETKGGKTSALSDSDAGKLKTQAAEMLKLARAKSPAKKGR
jgi:putative lipoprotein